MGCSLPVRLWIALVLLVAPLQQATGALPADQLAQILTLKAALAEVETVLNRALIGADSIASAKIQSAADQARLLIKQLDEIRKDAVNDARQIIEDVAIKITSQARSGGTCPRFTEMHFWKLTPLFPT